MIVRQGFQEAKNGTPCAIRNFVEATRIIPIPTNRPSQGQPQQQQPQQPSNIVRMEPAPGLIKIDRSQGKEFVSGGDGESTQRFASEVKYVTFYAQKLAETLGMYQLQTGIVEDREGQTAFQSSATGWHGAVSPSRRSLKQVKESLTQG